MQTSTLIAACAVLLCGCEARVAIKSQPIATTNEAPVIPSTYEMVEHEGQYAVRWPITGNVHPAKDRTDAEETVKLMREHDAKMAVEAARTEAANKLHWNVVTNDEPMLTITNANSGLTEFFIDAKYRPAELSLSASQDEFTLEHYDTNVITILKDGNVKFAGTNIEESAKLFWQLFASYFANRTVQ